MKKIQIKSRFDDTILYANVYEVEKPKAVIQVIHGMMEHQIRYEELAIRLNQAGFNVVTSDIRGHGHDISKENLGYMGNKKQWDALIIDQATISEYIKHEYPDNDIYIFAHSMGTMITRNLIQGFDGYYKKIILSGAPNYQSIANAGILVANIIGLFKGNHHKSNLLASMTLGPFTKAVPNYKTKNDWLSYNEENVEKYNNDPLCGFPFTVSAYKGLYHILVGMNKKKKFRLNNKDLPIYFISGKDDPCTGGPKGIISSIKNLQKVGYTYIHAKTYDNMRHEILKEKNKDEVYDDILKFYES